MNLYRFIPSCLAIVVSLCTPCQGESDLSTTNIVVFDASGSMWNKMENSTRIEIAREVMKQFLDDYDAKHPLGVIAYGHRKRGDCDDIEVLVKPSNVDPAKVSKQINALLPKGKTPLAESLRRAGQLIPRTAEDANILLITDGLETCDGDPCMVAKEMIAEGIKVRAHVVGFGLSKAEADSLSCIAALTGGKIFNPTNGAELLEALKQSLTTNEVEAPKPELPSQKTFVTTINLRNTGFGLPTGFMKWTATAPNGKVLDLGFHEGSELKTELPLGVWNIVADGPEGRGEGEVNVSVPEGRPYINFSASQISAEITNSTPLTAGVSAYISFRINSPPPGNSLSHFKIGIFPVDDPITRIVSSGQNRFVFAGRKITPGQYHSAVQMPKQPGQYKLAFVRSGEPKWTVLAEKEINVVAVPELKLEVPDHIVADSVFEPKITSGAGEYDRLTLYALNEDGTRGRQISSVQYSTHIQKNESLIESPQRPGKYLLVLVARTADSKISPETSVAFNVLSSQEYEAIEGNERNTAKPHRENEKSTSDEILVSLMIDGDAEKPIKGKLHWSLKPVVKDESGRWIYDTSLPLRAMKSKLLASQETQWNLAPGVWEVNVLVNNAERNRVLIEIDPTVNEHAFLIPSEKQPFPPIGQPTQWLISSDGGEAVLSESRETKDPNAKISVVFKLPNLEANAPVTWTFNPLEADGVTLSQDGRMGGGGNMIGYERTMKLAPGKWKLTAKSHNKVYHLVAEVQSGKDGQIFTLDRLFDSTDVKLDIAETILFQKDGFIPITLEVPLGFKGKVALHTEDNRDGSAFFEADAVDLAASTDSVVPMPAKPGRYEIQLKDAVGKMLLGLPFEVIAGNDRSKDESAEQHTKPKLREFAGANNYGTGTLIIEIDGNKHEFVTTRQILSPPARKSDNPEVQKFLDSMKGKVIDTAVLRLISGNLYVSLDAYGNIGDYGPDMIGKNRVSFEVKFTLNPTTLELNPGARELVYTPQGRKTIESLTTSDYELTLDSVTKLNNGEIALKGNFSGSLTKDIKGNKLEKPMMVKGTLDIYSASGNDSVGNLLRSN